MCSEISTRLINSAINSHTTAVVTDAFYSKTKGPALATEGPQRNSNSKQKLSARVEKIIYNDPLSYRHMINVAKLLNVSTRTLLRRLEADGTNFKKVRDQALYQRAIDELMLENMSATEVASSLAFSDPAHFTRAFTRWSGLTPCAFKDKKR
ncbi:AraC-type DNA-binding protein [Pseudomonas peli]|uniref:AraC-type DNA-binding protein n=2 Tax=Pseudomonadaceae TaxID=135621 RepID=A0AB37Z9W2_9PSED|nr:helix-turn-helix transcriptional regulator [Pseudomonas peli]RTT13487.1 AraC family transcriptional regulator [Pseudomonas aeruginosa]SCW70432.1 AraC-type DNA-binding protein [Pseudomonas peli]